nr:hypothetical protein [Tanacetum cinerariifolium]
MFEPHVEDEVWKMQQRYNVMRWTIYDSCGERIVRTKSDLNASEITAAHIDFNTAQDEVSIAGELQGLYTKWLLLLIQDSSGTQSRRSMVHVLMISFWLTRSAESMLKSLEILWISVQELRVKNSLSYKMMTIPSPSSLTSARKVHFTSTPAYQHYHTIKDDGIVSQLKFVRIEEDYQEYRLDIPDVMLNDAIKKSESYKMFIKYSTGYIPPRRAEAKVYKERRLLMTLRKLLIYLKNDNILPDPDIALELGKSISLAKAKEEEAAKQVHVTHDRIMTESIPKSANKKTYRRSSRSVVIQDTPMLQSQNQLLQSLSLKTSETQLGTEGSIKGTGTIPGVLDKSTVIFATSSEGTEEDQLDDEEKDDKEGDVDDEGDDHISDIQGEDEEMVNSKVEDSRKGDAEMSNVAKADVEKTEEANNDSKKVKLSPTSSSLFVSFGFSDHVRKFSSDMSSIGTVKDTTDAEISLLLDIKIQFDVSYIQSPSMLKLRVAKLEKDMLELKKIDHSVKALATLKSQVSTVVEQYLGSKIDDDLQRILKIKKEQAEKQKMPKYTIKSIDKATLKELYHALMEALIEDKNAIDKVVADTIKDHKRKHDDDDDNDDDDDDDDDEYPPAGINQELTKNNTLTGSVPVGGSFVPLSLSFDSVLSSEIVKSLSFCLYRLLPACDLMS